MPRAIIAPLKYAAHASMIVELSVLGIIVALIVPFRRRCRIPGTRRRCTSMTRVRGMLMTRMTRRVFTLEVIELAPTELRPGPIGVPCNWVELFGPTFNINAVSKTRKLRSRGEMVSIFSTRSERRWKKECVFIEICIRCNSSVFLILKNGVSVRIVMFEGSRGKR